MLTALEKLPADRFGTAAEFAEALAGRGTVPTRAAPRPPRAVPGAATERESPTGMQSSSGCWPASLVAAAAAAWGWLRPGPAPVVNRFSLYLPPEQALAAVNQSGNRVAISPDGQRIVYVGPAQTGHPALAPGARPAQRHADPRDRGRRARRSSHPTAATSGSWSAGRQLRTVSLDGGPDARRSPTASTRPGATGDRTATSTSRWTRASPRIRAAGGPRRAALQRRRPQGGRRRMAGRAARRQGPPLPDPAREPGRRRLPDRGHAAAAAASRTCSCGASTPATRRPGTCWS